MKRLVSFRYLATAVGRTATGVIEQAEHAALNLLAAGADGLAGNSPLSIKLIATSGATALRGGPQLVF